MGSVEDFDDVYSQAIYCQGMKLSLFALKGLELVYGIEEVATIRQLQHTEDHFSPSLIGDVIIDTRLYLLESQYPHITIVPCGRVHWWLRGGAKLEHIKQRKLRSGTTHILFPVNEENPHGNRLTLVVYSIIGNNFLHFDSLHGIGTSDPALAMLKLFVAKEFDLPCIYLSPVTKERFSQQHPPGKDFDCGVRLIHYAVLCAQELPYSTQFDSMKCRKDIFQVIMQNCE